METWSKTKEENFLNKNRTSFEIGNLNIIVENNESEIKMVLNGKSDHENPSNILDAYFNSIIEELKITKKLIMDFSELQFMNSATIPPLLRFIKILEKIT